ncbi:MAG: Hint domain-containing protein [Patescibacteria group bacterium]
MNKKGFVNIILVIVVIMIASAGVYFYLKQQTVPPPKPILTSIPDVEKINKTIGEREGSFLIQKINPDSVEGLWFAKYPIERPNDPGSPKILRIGDDIGYTCEGVSEKLINIDFPGQTITFNKIVIQPPYGGCPICLAGDTLIDTPLGLVPVKDLKIGMPIWTTNKTGLRVPGVIIKTSRVALTMTHQMVYLVLGNGRKLFISPGHPTIDGRTVGNLAAGDIYNGVSVVSTERVPCNQDSTYDILPSGETGFYWANGILFDSTLH